MTAPNKPNTRRRPGSSRPSRIPPACSSWTNSSRGERCVCELTDLIGVEMPTVSRHLSQLKNAGLLEDEKRGSQVFYRLRVPCVLNFFKCVKAVQTAHDAE